MIRDWQFTQKSHTYAINVNRFQGLGKLSSCLSMKIHSLHGDTDVKMNFMQLKYVNRIINNRMRFIDVIIIFGHEQVTQIGYALVAVELTLITVV